MTLGHVFSPNSGTCQHLTGNSSEPEATRTQYHTQAGCPCRKGCCLCWGIALLICTPGAMMA